MSEKEWWRRADASTAQTPRPRGRRRRLTRVLVAGGLVAGLTALAGPALASDHNSSASATDESHEGPGRGGGHDDGKDGGGPGARNVRCDPDALIVALSLANANNGGSLSLAPRCTYTLTANSGGNGLPTITERITIQGNDARIVRAANAERFRFFEIAAGGDLTLKGLTLSGGDSVNSGGAIAVTSGGRANLDRIKLENNRTENFGGAVTNGGDLTITDSTITRNFTEVSGGAVFSIGGFVRIKGTTMEYNTADGLGGGMLVQGPGHIEHSTFRHNNAQSGGGLFGSSASLTVEHTTFADNTGTLAAGGIGNTANLTLRNSDLIHNSSPRGGGISNGGIGGATLVATRVKLADNVSDSSGGGLYNSGAAQAVLRDSEITSNRAISGTGAGVYNIGADSAVSLVRTQVTGNDAGVAPGGVFSDNDGVTVDNRSVIVGNRPTNCSGSPVTIPNCFG